MLGLLKAQSGSVRVFGLDPVRDPVGVLSRIGYLSEDRDLPDWMRLRELLAYTKAFYPRWDTHYADELRRAFELPLESKVRQLSQGQRARAGLLLALAHRPELLVLDEPSTGLDPVVRRDILGAIIRTIAEEGRTVLFSSHLLEEVERVADFVGMLEGGRIQFQGPLDSIREQHRRVVVRFDQPQREMPMLEGMVNLRGSGHEWAGLYHGRLEDLELSLRGAKVVEQAEATLDEIFVARVARRQATAHGEVRK